MTTKLRFVLNWLICSLVSLLACYISYGISAACIQALLEASGPCDGYLGILIALPPFALLGLLIPFGVWIGLKSGRFKLRSVVLERIARIRATINRLSPI